MDGIDRRSLIALPASLALLGPAGIVHAATASPLPLLPLNINFSYWDHHWIHWLPDHPIYEAIEVALGGPLPSGEPLVRLWFTERADGKRQIYYFNDAATPRTFGQESHFVPIKVERTGAAGMPQNLSLSFTEKDGAPVVWEVRFPAGQPLSTQGAGLKPQNGHAGHSVLLFWYIDKGALTADAVCTIGGVEHRPKPGGETQRRVNTAYSSGAYSAALPFGQSEFTPTPAGFRSSWGGRDFVRDHFRYTARFQAFHQPAMVELLAGSDGALIGYDHAHRDHHFSLVLQTALRLDGEPTNFWFKIDDRTVARGTVTPSVQHTPGVERVPPDTLHALAWDFTDPEWAREMGLLVYVESNAGGPYSIGVTPLH